MKKLKIILSIAFVLLANPMKADEFASKLVNAASSQIGVTVHYDPAYVRLAYPDGDIPRSKGVCTDVIIRALRDAHDIDLQQRVHQDMKSNFRSYPQQWGLKRADSNIDHRRVPNLRRYFERRGHEVPVTRNPSDYLEGDIVTWNLPGNLTHIGIVSANRLADGTPTIIHNIGQGTRDEDILFAYEITGHYRLN